MPYIDRSYSEYLDLSQRPDCPESYARWKAWRREQEHHEAWLRARLEFSEQWLKEHPWPDSVVDWKDFMEAT